MTEALLSSNYVKCKWVKLSGQKTKSGRMDKSPWCDHMLPIRDSQKSQRHK